MAVWRKPRNASGRRASGREKREWREERKGKRENKNEKRKDDRTRARS